MGSRPALAGLDGREVMPGYTTRMRSGGMSKSLSTSAFVKFESLITALARRTD